MIDKKTTKRSINTLRGVSSDMDNIATNDRIRSEIKRMKSGYKIVWRNQKRKRVEETKREKEKERDRFIKNFVSRAKKISREKKNLMFV